MAAFTLYTNFDLAFEWAAFTLYTNFDLAFEWAAFQRLDQSLYIG
jgi:hypothetical protein